MKQKASGLEIDDDPPFQERFWTFQRIAWLFLGLIVVAALLGLTGQGGPLARAEASGPAGSVDYPRVARWETSDDLQIRLPPVAAGKVIVGIDDRFARLFEIEDIQPAPRDAIATSGGQQLVFDVAGAPGEKVITIHVRAMQPSLVNRLRVRIGDGPELVLTPVVLP